jgi:hypothetical protein
VAEFTAARHRLVHARQLRAVYRYGSCELSQEGRLYAAVLAIEIDGDRWHGTKFRRKFDARKQAIVEAPGYRVLRLAEDDPQREAETVARIWNGLT